MLVNITVSNLWLKINEYLNNHKGKQYQNWILEHELQWVAVRTGKPAPYAYL